MTRFPDVTPQAVLRQDRQGAEALHWAAHVRIQPGLAVHPDQAGHLQPKSRIHLGERLQKVYGWTPQEFGGKDGTQAVVDEGTIKALHCITPELKALILEDLVVTKTLGQVSDGKKAWNDLAERDGRLHGRVDPLGRSPIVVPTRTRTWRKCLGLGGGGQGRGGCRSRKAYHLGAGRVAFGAGCRSLFIPRPGWEQTGTDAAGLGAENAGHYLEPLTEVPSPRGSVRQAWTSTRRTPRSLARRGQTKMVTAFLYGAGSWKLGVRGRGHRGGDRHCPAQREAASYIAFRKKQLGTSWSRPTPTWPTSSAGIEGQEEVPQRHHWPGRTSRRR